MRKAIFAVTIFVTAAFGDTLTLKNGQTVQGTYLGGNAREIRIDTGDGVQTFAVGDVSTLQFDTAGPAASAAPPNSRYNRDAGYGNNQPPPQSAGLSIPAGTVITVRMVDAVDSDSSRLGRTYRASVDEPVVINGQVVIPRGADAVTKVVEDRQSGKIQGQTAVGLVLQSVTVNGRPVDVTSGDVTQTSSSRGARSAKVIGGTAALGTILGAIAGGGKGAAIGAASGAAVGTGAEVLTHGQRVHIPSESRLNFTLSYPVNL
jgi:hypothetical protein